jgi:hypothetical protein
MEVSCHFRFQAASSKNKRGDTSTPIVWEAGWISQSASERFAAKKSFEPVGYQTAISWLSSPVQVFVPTELWRRLVL